MICNQDLGSEEVLFTEVLGWFPNHGALIIISKQIGNNWFPKQIGNELW